MKKPYFVVHTACKTIIDKISENDNFPCSNLISAANNKSAGIALQNDPEGHLKVTRCSVNFETRDRVEAIRFTQLSDHIIF